MCLRMSAHVSCVGIMCRVGQDHIYAPYRTIYLVISLQKLLYLYLHRLYMVLVNPTTSIYATSPSDS